MRSRGLRVCSVAIALTLSGPLGGVATAQAPKSAVNVKPLAQSLTGGAKADYDAAKVLASDGDFAGALIKFQSAYDQSKDPRLLYNVAFCEKNLRHYAKAIAALQRYLADGTGFLTDKDRKEADGLIQTFQPFTTNATFKVSEDGAQIFVDETPAGVSPLAAPVVLDIGERHIRVVKDGFRPFEKTLPVGGSAAVAVDVTLEKEVHEGHLVVDAPAGASIVLDGGPPSTGKLDATVPAGGHQLRVTAPGMRPFQSEVVIQDKETRSIQVALEPDAAAEIPKIRVAIGCDGPEPKGPDDGLVVYLDGPDVVAPANVKKKWSDDLGRNVVEYVEYPAVAGKHTLRARIPDCESLETAVTVDATKGGDVAGALESDTPTILAGPQGSPGHWRVGAGVSIFRPGDDIQYKNMPDTYQGGFAAANGAFVEAAFVGRWFGVTTQWTYDVGSVQRKTYNSNYLLPSSPSYDVFSWTVRPGFRVPFNVVALSLGPEAGFTHISIDQVYGGPQAEVGGFVAVDVQPFCDWGLTASGDLGAVTGNNSGSPLVNVVNVGLFFEPNPRCQRERSTRFGLFPGGQ
jgi:hypothetical protein